MQVRLRGIHRVKRRLANGTESLHYYHRATKQRLDGIPGSPEFLASYAAACKTQTDYLGDTFAKLIKKFEDSSDFRGTAKSTQYQYRQKFSVIDRQWGSCPTSALSDREFRRDVLAWRDRIALKTPRQADHLVAAMARVLAFGVDRGEITVNMLAHFSRAYHSDRAEQIWTQKDIAAFKKVADPALTLAMDLALHTGQRQGDLLCLRWTDYNGRVLSLKQSKTGVRVTVPCTTALKTALDSLPRRADTILHSPTGLAWDARNFRQRWAKTTKKAKLKDLHFHDLRGTAITLLAEAGSTVPEIASITGHRLESVSRILETYLARTSKLSDSAIEKLERHLATRPTETD